MDAPPPTTESTKKKFTKSRLGKYLITNGIYPGTNSCRMHYVQETAAEVR